MPFESANTKQGALSPAARGLGATDFASSAAAMMDPACTLFLVAIVPPFSAFKYPQINFVIFIIDMNRELPELR
jgi:hypothetical protein